MAVKKVFYKEPDDYFSPGMRKVAEKWDKENAKKQATKKSTDKKKK